MQFILNCSVFGGLLSIENAPFIRVQVMQEPIARRGEERGEGDKRGRERRGRMKGRKGEGEEEKVDTEKKPCCDKLFLDTKQQDK